MPDSDGIEIDPLSATSLLLKLRAEREVISQATGFLVNVGEQKYLITNWHVVTGRHPVSGRRLEDLEAEPDQISIVHHGRVLGSWEVITEELYDSQGNARWVEHATGRQVDMVGLPLENISRQIAVYPLDLSLAEVDIKPQPGMPVFVIGYPYGLTTAGGWPIWKTGHIASDPDLDFEARPAFVIDATTRGGMSGSPVVLRSYGGYRRRDGSLILASGPVTRFLGVYSGRIHEDAEIGLVWRPSLIGELTSL